MSLQDRSHHGSPISYPFQLLVMLFHQPSTPRSANKLVRYIIHHLLLSLAFHISCQCQVLQALFSQYLL